jgi:hypothetical protein
MENNMRIHDRLTRLETNMEWVKKQQYMLLGMQLSMITGLVLMFIRGVRGV